MTTCYSLLFRIINYYDFIFPIKLPIPDLGGPRKPTVWQLCADVRL